MWQNKADIIKYKMEEHFKSFLIFLKVEKFEKKNFKTFSRQKSIRKLIKWVIILHVIKKEIKVSLVGVKKIMIELKER